MSLLTTASLVVTPNGYKEGTLYSVIPSDGSGDMSVTRATTATRVNSAGLVELVPYNQFTWSQNFDNAAWNKTNCSITANNTTAPDGTITADKLILANGQSGSSSDGTGIRQLVDIASGSYTYSIYAKAAEFTTIRFREIQVTGAFLTIDLTNGAITNGGVGQYINPTATLVSNGWYRITFQTPTLTALYKYSVRVSETGNGTSGIFIWGYQAVEGSNALPYQKTETRLNIPRLDYSNGTCPSLLVEPQRTNVLQRSQEFDNGFWTKQEITITANATTAPDGTQTADKATPTTVTGTHQIQTGTLISSTQCAFGVFAKADGYNTIQILDRASAANGARFNILNGTIEQTFGTATATITDFGNGWYRCVVVANTTGVRFYIPTSASNFTGDGTSGIFVWGAQLEVGSYSTSYIPTTSASVTRNADVISKTGISSLIGQTEGTLFAEVDITALQGATARTFIDIGSSGNRVFVGFTSLASNTIRLQIDSGGVIVVDYRAVVSSAGTIKVAAAYKNGNCALYVDGVAGTLVANGAISFTTISNLFLGQTLSSSAILGGGIKAAALWQTRLTNDELATLTTI